LERWTAGVLFARLERWTAGVVLRLLALAVVDLALTFLEADVDLTSALLRSAAATFAGLLEAVLA
jgi:hypothetical protein